MEDKNKDFDIVKIMKVIPHRYPMLLVDRILEIDEKRVVGKKCVSMDEHFFRVITRNIQLCQEF